MGRIPDELIQQIRDRVDIVDLVGRFVTLKKAGRNYKGLCPFHDEKSPSFNVNPDRQSFYCFGCHEGGNALTFLMRSENLTFPEAVRTLGRECGIEVPEFHSGAGAADSGLTERLVAANEVAQDCFRASLASLPNPGAAYLEQRGLDAETIERFDIGFAPDSWDTLVSELRAKRISGEDGERAGLLVERQSAGGHYDRFRGRVVFPIRDARGRIIGFGGRAIGADQEPKYLNSPETPLFRKREAFYGFPQALEPIRRRERAVVVEGYFDQIALCRAGIEEAIATCGTALTPDHARNLRRRTHHVVLLFDGDEAGQRAIERSLEVLLPAGLRVSAAALPPGEDPDSFLEREGGEALRALVDGAPAAIDRVIERASEKGCASPWEKADAVAVVAPLVALIPSGVERAEFARRLALSVGTEPRHVEAAVAAAARGRDARDAMPIAPRVTGPEERHLRQLVQSLIEHPQLAGRIDRDEFSELAPACAAKNLVLAIVDDERVLAAATAGERSGLDLDRIGDVVVPDERTLLFSLAAGDEAPEEAAAARTIDDVLAKLRKSRKSAQQHALTDQLRRSADDPHTLLNEKKQLMKQETLQGEEASAPSLGNHP